MREYFGRLETSFCDERENDVDECSTGQNGYKYARGTRKEAYFFQLGESVLAITTGTLIYFKISYLETFILSSSQIKSTRKEIPVRAIEETKPCFWLYKDE